MLELYSITNNIKKKLQKYSVKRILRNLLTEIFYDSSFILFKLITN